MKTIQIKLKLGSQRYSVKETSIYQFLDGGGYKTLLERWIRGAVKTVRAHLNLVSRI